MVLYGYIRLLITVKIVVRNFIIFKKGGEFMNPAYEKSLSASELAKLVDNLNYVNNSIMMCDTKGRITFANSTFCRNFHVSDPAKVIGLTMEEIMELGRTHITTIETASPTLRMYEVLKTGKPVLDWPVLIESYVHKDYHQIVFNDMFPTFDKNENVNGFIEISRLQQQEIKKLKKNIGLNAEYVFDDVIGNSPSIKHSIKLAKDFATNRGTVLITGESGVGKEIFAQSIHNYSSRSRGPFVALNCANFPAELIESELFGYVEGAFTGASKKGQMGKFELANGGTLFLDEIGELPYYFQSKLLRVLETWTITRVGGINEIPVDVRLIAATNRDLPEMIRAGLFRQDLYYRLQVLNLDLPPLRSRKEDIPLIAEYFLKIFARQNSHRQKELTDKAKAELMAYDWPGNARELKNVINRIDLLHKGEEITGDVITTALFGTKASRGASPEETSESPNANTETPSRISSVKIPLTPEERIDRCREDIDAAYIKLLQEALSITRGNKKEAAELLGIARKTIYRLLEKYNLPLQNEKP